MADHAAVTRVLHTMSLDGWATADAGDVESPTGWFAYLYNDPRDAESLLDAFGEDLTDEALDVADIMGGWVLYCDNYGFRDAVEYSTERDARMAFEALDAEYGAWLDADDDAEAVRGMLWGPDDSDDSDEPAAA